MQGSVERKPIAGEVFLRALAEHGVDYFFANPGTDFPPIVEAFPARAASNAKLPRPVLVPHENLAVAMAHGATIMTGRPQAVMVHVNVGTGNTLNNLINLSRDRVPLILAAGRTPITEKGSFGSRSRQIHWGQEMFDQAGMVREMVKWDYELRVPGQIADVVARAHEVAMTPPRGPVYLVLPREPLSASLGEAPAIVPRPVPASPHPDPAAIAQLAGWIAQAERPLIITAGPGTDGSAVAALAKVAERAAIPVVMHNARSLALPSSPSDACGVRLRAAGRRSRPHHRASKAMRPGIRACSARCRLPRRPYRRGPGVRALSDALVPERSVDCLACRDRTRGARCGAREAEAQCRCAPRASSSSATTRGGKGREGEAGANAQLRDFQPCRR